MKRLKIDFKKYQSFGKDQDDFDISFKGLAQGIIHQKEIEQKWKSYLSEKSRTVHDKSQQSAFLLRDEDTFNRLKNNFNMTRKVEDREDFLDDTLKQYLHRFLDRNQYYNKFRKLNLSEINLQNN